MSVNRRDALKFLGCGAAGLGAVSATAFVGKNSHAHEVHETNGYGLMYDTTKCIGCMACVTACNRANGLPPETDAEGLHLAPPTLSAKTKNIIQLFKDDAGDYSFVKRQCMHCLDPSCVSGCPFEALEKAEHGIVVWHENKCLGCRFCAIACPYEIPKFDWENFNPKIVKCELCSHRIANGQITACTDVCPTGAVIFGKREDLLREAKQRIAQNPGTYFENRVYGETEGGGTQVLYLSHVPFEDIGLPTLSDVSNPAYALEVQSLMYKWMAVPTLLYAGMATAVRRSWKEHEEEHGDEEHGLREQL
jgi:Fe-S-cluster-containing dehydrogenase component